MWTVACGPRPPSWGYREGCGVRRLRWTRAVLCCRCAQGSTSQDEALCGAPEALGRRDRSLVRAQLHHCRGWHALWHCARLLTTLAHAHRESAPLLLIRRQAPNSHDPTPLVPHVRHLLMARAAIFPSWCPSYACHHVHVHQVPKQQTCALCSQMAHVEQAQSASAHHMTDRTVNARKAARKDAHEDAHAHAHAHAHVTHTRFTCSSPLRCPPQSPLQVQRDAEPLRARHPGIPTIQHPNPGVDWAASASR